MKAFDSIKADETLKQKTLEAAKEGTKVKKTRVIRWGVLSAVAAALVLTVSLTAIFAGGLFGGEKTETQRNSAEESHTEEFSLVDGSGFDYSGDAEGDPAELPIPAADMGFPSGEKTASESGKPVKSGTLTAGKINDNEHYAEYVKPWNDAQRTQDAFLMNALHRVKVTVQNGQGQPLYQAQVLLKSGQKTVYTAKSDAKGKAYLFYRWAKGFEDAPDAVEVVCAGENVRVPLENKEEITVTVDAQNQTGKELDLMFVIDTTGSMGDELEYLKAETEAMIRQMQTQLDTRVSMNFYRDEGDEYVVRSYDFTASVPDAVEQLRAESAAGGGDNPEAVDQALKNAVADHAWRDDAVKILFLVLDAPAHEEEDVIASLTDTVLSAAAQGIRIVPVVSSGADEITEELCRHLALFTGGQYVFLTDDSGVGGSHREPITTVPYEVKPLIEILNDVLTEYTTF